MTTLIPTLRIEKLHTEIEALEQHLLTIDPDTDLFWLLTRSRDAKQAEIDNLRKV